MEEMTKKEITDALKAFIDEADNYELEYMWLCKTHNTIKIIGE